MEYLVALTNIQNKIRGLFLLLGACVLLVRHSGIRSYIPREKESLNIYIEEAHVTNAAAQYLHDTEK